MGIFREVAAGAIGGAGGGGGFSGAGMGALRGAAGLPGKKRSTDVSGAGAIPGQEEFSDEGSGEGRKRPNGKRSNGKSRG